MNLVITIIGIIKTDKLPVFWLLTLLLSFSCGEEEPLIEENSIGNSRISKNRNGLTFSRIQQGPLEFACDSDFEFVAGQTIDVGTINVSGTEEEVKVTFITDMGWKMRKTHLYIGTEAGIPLNNAGNPQIGRFTFQTTHEPAVTTFTYTINRDELDYDNTLDCENGLVIATHAEVQLLDEAGTIMQEETAWGLGNKEFPGERWGWYFSGCLSGISPSVEITGGGTICQGETAILIFTFSGEKPFNFVFTDQNGNTSNIETSEPVYEVNVSEAGIYGVTSIMDASHCPASELGGSVEVVANSLPEVLSVSDTETTICSIDDDPSNDTVDLIFNFSGSAPFAGHINGESFISETNGYIFSAGAGTYAIETLVDANGCSAKEFGKEIIVTEECEDDNDEDEGDGDDGSVEEDGEEDSEDDSCNTSHDYYNGYCKTHTSAFAFGGRKAFCFLGYGFNRWGWTNRIYEGSYTWDIYADVGNCDPYWGIVVGTLEVDYFDGTATISYNLNDPYMSWGALHAYIGYAPLPQIYGYPTILPRKYPHQSDGCTKTTFSCPGLSGPIYVIAHAELIL